MITSRFGNSGLDDPPGGIGILGKPNIPDWAQSRAHPLWAMNHLSDFSSMAHPLWNYNQVPDAGPGGGNGPPVAGGGNPGANPGGTPGGPPHVPLPGPGGGSGPPHTPLPGSSFGSPMPAGLSNAINIPYRAPLPGPGINIPYHAPPAGPGINIPYRGPAGGWS